MSLQVSRVQKKITPYKITKADLAPYNTKSTILKQFYNRMTIHKLTYQANSSKGLPKMNPQTSGVRQLHIRLI